MAAYKAPRYVEFRDQLPMGATGKVLKRELRCRSPGRQEGVKGFNGRRLERPASGPGARGTFSQA